MNTITPSAHVNIPLAQLDALVSKRLDAFTAARGTGGWRMKYAGERLVWAMGEFLGQPVGAADVWVDNRTVADILKDDANRDGHGRFAHTDSRGGGSHETKPPPRSGEHAETHGKWDEHETAIANNHRAEDDRRNDERCDAAHARYESRIAENPAAAREYKEPPLSAGFRARVEDAAARVASKCVSVVKAADRVIGRLMPAFEAIMDCPADMVKFGYEPTMHGNAMQSIDPIRTQLGISAHLAASLLTKAVCTGMKLARKSKGDAGEPDGAEPTHAEVAAGVRAIRTVWFHAAIGIGCDSAAARQSVPPRANVERFIREQWNAK